MITILERYIAKNLYAAIGLAALTIVGILFLMGLLGELKGIGEGDYGILQAIIYVILRLPNTLYQFSPLWILLGSIVGLSMLSAHRELAVMRASGFSIRHIILSVLGAAFALIMLISLIGEWAGPHLSYRAEIYKENAKNAGAAVVTASGIWFHVDDNFIHVEQVVDRQLLQGVTRYQFDEERRLQAAYYAKKLTYQNNTWTMQDVVKTSFYEDRTKSQHFDTLPWDVKFNTNLFNFGLVEPAEMSLPKLTKFIHYMQQNHLQASEYQFVFWQRVFQPLASLVMIFLAIPFVLGALHQSPLGFRILIGVLAGFGFFILNALLGQLSIVFQLPTFLAALLPIFLFAGLGLFLTNKLIKH